MAFVPYWFFGAAHEASISELLNAEQIVGVHVPKIVPADLSASGVDYFSAPGDKREIGK